MSNGDLVLIKEDNPRLKWPLGVVTDVFIGKDGLVRSVKVKTKKGEMTRPVKKLYELEVGRSEELITSNVSCDDLDKDVPVCDMNPKLPLKTVNDDAVIPKSRSGRVIKAPTKLDL